MVVLAFVVLLTGLIIAFFSRSMTGRQLSNNSSGQMRAATMARSASDTIIAGFKQEIAAGSKSTQVGPASSPSLLYVPTTAANAVPVRYPTPAPNANPADPIPNLVRTSVHGDTANNALPSPAVPSSASAVNSAGDAALDGRKVTAARWNSHFLIPSQSTATVANSAPDTSVNFTAPDWVLVTRNGPAVQTAVGSGSGALNDATAANGNFVIGRYAFAVYDEGGLLDINVAGHPTPATTAAQTGFTPTQVSRKGSLALADLTQLPLVKNPSPAPSSDYLAQSMVESIVGWRNYASAGLSGSSYPNFTFSATQAASWFTNFATNNTSGFLKAYGGGSTNVGATDQAFLSRQQLLRMRGSMGFSANLLQYLGTFSRGLEQPSFQPDPNRPTILPTTLPPPAGQITSYQGNNSYAGGDAAINFVGVPGGLLSVRVTGPFTRLDGSAAVVGEPLVKRRFALSRLLLVTSSATANMTAGDPIYDRFGLYRSDASSSWVYNHGASNIMTLTQVAAQNREPDMAELLKAAINVGSVGKATHTNQGSDLEYTYDISGDRQILQIMANLIDQAKSDNYPTQIQPFSSAQSTLAVYGVQDLPYFYSYHYLNLTTKLPRPLLSSTDKVQDTMLGAADTNYTNHISAQPLADPGAASCLIIPEVWNPHDANTVPAPAGGPTQFRVVAETTDPTGTLGYWQVCASPSTNGNAFDGNFNLSNLNPPTSASSAYAALSMPVGADSSNSALAFTDGSGGKAFREPTLLWRNGLPTGVTLSGTSRTEDSTPTPGGTLAGKTYYGILVGDSAVSWTVTVSDNSIPPNNVSYVCQSSSLHQGFLPGPSGSITPDMTFRMQYKNSAGKWITYQNAFVEARVLDYVAYGLFVNPADYDSQQYKNPLAPTVNDDGLAFTASRGGPYDPRTPRFASPLLGYWNNDDPALNGNPALDAVPMINNYNDGTNGTQKFTAAQNQAVADSNFVVLATQRPATSRGQYLNWTGPGQSDSAQMRWYSASTGNNGNFFGGLLSQNNPAVWLNSSGNTSMQNYYEDADRVCRRAMGAYATVSATKPTGTSRLTSTTSTIGLPMVTASTFSIATGMSTTGIGTTTTQSQSRPIILHRPFASVAEMGVVFRGTPWKNIDFFTPESGDTALLDVFCVNEPPPDAVVAGKVNLNTHQIPVLQAVLAGAYRDELTTNALPALTNTEAANVASVLVDITTNPSNKTWRGPLTNVADLVGHFVANAGSVSGSDVYQYTSNGGGSAYTYAGLSAALSGQTPGGNNIWDSSGNTSASSQAIQRFRESAIRSLASCGQTRVWNLMIDVVAQSGRYTPNSTALSQFAVDGEVRCWVHVAIDRATGEIIDEQTELVTE